MNLSDVVAELERRRADAARYQATAPVATVLRDLIEELKRLDGIPSAERYMDSDEATEVLPVDKRTVARWCKQGRFSGARKSAGARGKWLIPASQVYQVAADKNTRSKSRGPKLWEAS